MPKRAIVARQVLAQVVGPGGPVDVGKWDEVTTSDEIEILEHKPIDGSVEHLVEGYKYSGTLKRGVYDPAMAHIAWELAHPGSADPPRHLLLISETYNDGSVEQRLYKEVLFTKRGESMARGAPVTEDIDWVDPDSGEITKVDGLVYSLRECCSQREDYVTRVTALTTAIFRLFIANGNTPLSAVQLHDKIGKSNPDALLRTLLGTQMRTHYGIRPILD